ncbi:MAG: hypothetical protein JNK63_08270 [Chthonomonas sp.]|nr:hypothetical protein [Chthonomonas sp.]
MELARDEHLVTNRFDSFDASEIAQRQLVSYALQGYLVEVRTVWEAELSMAASGGDRLAKILLQKGEENSETLPVIEEESGPARLIQLFQLSQRIQSKQTRKLMLQSSFGDPDYERLWLVAALRLEPLPTKLPKAEFPSNEAILALIRHAENRDLDGLLMLALSNSLQDFRIMRFVFKRVRMRPLLALRYVAHYFKTYRHVVSGIRGVRGWPTSSTPAEATASRENSRQ